VEGRAGELPGGDLAEQQFDGADHLLGRLKVALQLDPLLPQLRIFHFGGSQFKAQAVVLPQQAQAHPLQSLNVVLQGLQAGTPLFQNLADFIVSDRHPKWL
jgi:hypothetical protein